jgi:hypothetical protein
MLKYLKCHSICRSTFFDHQRDLLHPAILSVWDTHRTGIVSTLRDSGKTVVLGGDGRSDSPGHSAMFGSYSMLELSSVL